ncbi:MAG: DinB family protein [Gemmatimonadota bacterium]
MADDASIRDLLARVLGWGEAHLTLEAAVEGLDPALRGVRPTGLPHSIWELVEHIRIAQRDLLDFTRPGAYSTPDWPREYWPDAPAPPDDAAWARTLERIREDALALSGIVHDPAIDLSAPVPHGDRAGQTYARSLLVAQDHAAYHIGQVVTVRQLLEAAAAG